MGDRAAAVNPPAPTAALDLLLGVAVQLHDRSSQSRAANQYGNAGPRSYRPAQRQPTKPDIERKAKRKAQKAARKKQRKS